MATRSYKSAIEHLNSLQSNAATLDAVRASGGRLTLFAIPEMIEYLGRIGYKPHDLNNLNVIHITGTKGKGSTSAFTASILHQVKPEWKIGLYTSPHLVAVRERIRINGVPISEEDFAKFFFEVWDKLEENDVHPSTSTKPMYFRFLTLVAYHAFLTLKVDATVLEVGVGGTYDCTNIVPKPIVTGITSLGIDHTAVLGKTLQEIAWQKGGIFKEGVPALTVNQPAEGLSVLQQRANELKASRFTIVPSNPGLSGVKLGLAGVHQYQNASIAMHLAQEFLQKHAGEHHELHSDPFVKGLEKVKWPGRCQVIRDPSYTNTTWFLDGAHTVESLDCCMQWFVSPGVGIPLNDNTLNSPIRALIFNCTSGRSGDALLGGLLVKTTAQLELHGYIGEAKRFFDYAIFCTNVTYADGGFKDDLTSIAIPEADLTDLKTQKQLATAWFSLMPGFVVSRIQVLPSIEHAVNVIRRLAAEPDTPSVDVLVTGSLHLVGGVIEVAHLSDVTL